MPCPLRRQVGGACAAAFILILLGAPRPQAQMKGNFDDADADHDGRVTLQEFENYVTRRLMSSNGPMAQQCRELGPQQQAAQLRRRFERMDKGNKGYLTREDWDGA